MKSRQWLGVSIAGLCAGAVTGLLGAGGGMVLVPLLTLLTQLEDWEIFPSSVSIILPICLVSLLFMHTEGKISFADIVPYLLGSALGGLAAGIWGKNIPVKWLHRTLGIFVLWGGVRYLAR